MTDPDKKKQPRRIWGTAAHMLGFGLLLALMILLAKGSPVDREDGGRVVFTEADLAHVSAAFERTWSRPPTAIELRNAFDRYVRDEVFYREALARGLDRNDPVVKMSLVLKITMLGTAQAQATEPTDAEFEAFFELRTERYRIPGSFDLLQVCLSTDKHGERAETVASELLVRFREQEPHPERLAELGDMLMLPNVARNATEDNLVRIFGTECRDAVLSLPVGEWEGPVESGFGLHLVKITQRQEPRIPEWTEVRDRIANDMQFEGRTAAEDQFYSEILPRYEVIYSKRLDKLLQGDEGQRSAAP
jgi:hypothetical protein